MAESNQLFSILVANYNNSRYLDQCLQSVLSQTFSHWEVIILDDGSTDNFDEVIKAYAGDRRIKVHRNGVNKGCAFTKMHLPSLANGEILAFLDADDALDPTALGVLVEAHALHPECSLIHTTHYVCDSELKPLYVSPHTRALPDKTPYLMVSDGSVHHFASFKKAAYEASEKLTPDHRFDRVGDQELYYLVEEHGAVLFIDKPLHYYRIHSGSISNWGNERSSTNAHHEVIVQQCRKRIQKLRALATVDHATIRMYKTKLHRTLIISALRNKQWGRFAQSIVVYPFVGGSKHFVDYIFRFLRSRKKTMGKTISNYKIDVPHEKAQNATATIS